VHKLLVLYYINSQQGLTMVQQLESIICLKTFALRPAIQHTAGVRSQCNTLTICPQNHS